MRSIAILMMTICGAVYAAAAEGAARPDDCGRASTTASCGPSRASWFRWPKPCPPRNTTSLPLRANSQKVRTFGLQVRHVATTLYMIGAAVQKVKNPVDQGTSENGPDHLKSKEDIVKFLKDAFAFTHKGLQMLTAENQLEMVPSPFGGGSVARGGIASAAVWHSFDHYGQDGGLRPHERHRATGQPLAVLRQFPHFAQLQHQIAIVIHKKTPARIFCPTGSHHAYTNTAPTRSG